MSPEPIDDEEAEQNLGPDERDRDLMDGSWEAEYYSGRQRTVNWNAVTVGMSLLVVAGLVIPLVLVLFN